MPLEDDPQQSQPEESLSDSVPIMRDEQANDQSNSIRLDEGLSDTTPAIREEQKGLEDGLTERLDDVLRGDD